MGRMEIIACEQNTPEWYQARLGLVTASEFKTVLAKGKGGGESKTRQTYMYKLAGEILTGEQMDRFSNAHTEHGHEVEGEARLIYEVMTGAQADEVGFIRSGRKGCSPDGLVGDAGMAEFKRKLPHILIGLIEAGRFPPEHKAQCQGQLWIAEREWVDLFAYYPGMPHFVIREHRDEGYIQKLAEAVDQFNEELDALVARIRAYGVLS